MDYKQAKKLYLDHAPSWVVSLPCMDNCSERMGGWILKSNDDRYIGFVSNSGSIKYIDPRVK